MERTIYTTLGKRRCPMEQMLKYSFRLTSVDRSLKTLSTISSSEFVHVISALLFVPHATVACTTTRTRQEHHPAASCWNRFGGDKTLGHDARTRPCTTGRVRRSFPSAPSVRRVRAYRVVTPPGGRDLIRPGFYFRMPARVGGGGSKRSVRTLYDDETGRHPSYVI